MIQFKPQDLFRYLTLAVTILVAVHIMVHALYFATDQSGLVWPLLGLFNVGRDGNIPTVYSFLAMFVAAAMLAGIAWIETTNRREPSQHLYWWGLTLIFLFLACDESIQLHERLIEPIRELLGSA